MSRQAVRRHHEQVRYVTGGLDDRGVIQTMIDRDVFDTENKRRLVSALAEGIAMVKDEGQDVTPDRVIMVLLEEAMLTLHCVERGELAKLMGGGCSWPRIIRTAAERFAAQVNGEKILLRTTATPQAIDRMDECLCWFGMIFGGKRGHAVIHREVMLMLSNKVSVGSVQEVLKIKRRQSVYDYRDRSLKEIKTGIDEALGVDICTLY